MKYPYEPQPSEGWRVSQAGNYVLDQAGIRFTVYVKDGVYRISTKRENEPAQYWPAKCETAPEAKALVERVLRERHGVTGAIPRNLPIAFPDVRKGKNEALNPKCWGPVGAHGVIEGDMGAFGKLRFAYATTGLTGDDKSRLAIEFGTGRSDMIEFRHLTFSKVFFVLGGDCELRTFADALEKLAAKIKEAL